MSIRTAITQPEALRPRRRSNRLQRAARSADRHHGGQTSPLPCGMAKRKKENELFAQKIIQEKQKIEAELQQQLRKSITADFENKLRILEDSNKDNEEKLKLV